MQILQLTETDSAQSNALVRKLRVKIMSRVATTEIPPHGNHDFEIPEILEEILDWLLSSLSDKDTIVRYTTAKAVSRIVLSLPAAFADEIISTLFQKMGEGLLKQTPQWDFSSVDENSWHGCLLCLADIAWYRPLPSNQIEDTITYSLNVLISNMV
jgi:tubulin-specific chaperone D